MRTPLAYVRSAKHNLGEKIATRNWVNLSLAISDPKGFTIYSNGSVVQEGRVWLTHSENIRVAMLPRVGDRMFIHRGDMSHYTIRQLVGSDMGYFQVVVTEVEHVVGRDYFCVKADVIDPGSIVQDLRGIEQTFHAYRDLRFGDLDSDISKQLHELKRLQYEAEENIPS